MPGADDDKNQPGAANEKDPTDNQDPENPGGEGENDGGEGGGLDLSDPKKVEAEIKKLRRENAKHRTDNKELKTKLSGMDSTLSKLKKALGGEDDETPEEKAEKLTKRTQELETELAITELARDYEIPKESDKYFRFLLSQKMEGLKDNEELGEDDLAEIVKEAKGISRGNKPNKTGVDGSGKNNNPNPDDGKTLTVEQFADMSLSERSLLYVKNVNEYNRLFAGAKAKGLL